MSQKKEILSLLKAHGSMTQGELAEAIYGDKFHTPYIYSALMSLVSSHEIIRSEARPAKYSCSNTAVSRQEEPKKTSFSGSTDAQISPFQVKQQSPAMSVEYAIGLIRDYFNETVKDVHGRYMSWRHCYRAFSENRNKRDEQTVDYLALHLAFYLASWGMYRGSSFLLQKDYKVHIPVVRIIQEEKYHTLAGISAKNLCQRSNLILLEEIGARIKACYAVERPVCDGIPNHATDTLITKILLGTLGCVPAYDRYYVESVKKHQISTGRYNADSVYCVAKFYCDNFEVFEKLRQELSQCGIEYPPMKLMDMCFWQDTYMEELKQR